MNILHVYKTYYPDPTGGLQEAIRQIALSTKSETVNVRIFCLSPSPMPSKVVFEEGEVYRYKSWASPGSCDLGFLESIKGFKECVMWADIVHYQFPWPFSDVLHFLIFHNKPTVLTYHSDVVEKGILGSVYYWLMKKMLQSMDVVVATSPKYVESSKVLQTCVFPEKLRVIPLGIDENVYQKYSKENSKSEILQRFDLEDDGYFLFIGVLRKYKGIDYLIEASKKSRLPIVIAGSGPLHKHYTELSKSHDNVSLLGQISDTEKVALIQGCRGFILPSHLRSEAFGMVLVEASIFAKPLITCEIGTGTSFVNLDQETGFVVPPKNPKELALAMNKLANDVELARKMGVNARNRYERNFSNHALGLSYLNLYKEVIKS
jgi:glycosyltransferase involved in cell wall biosynthesis